MLPFLYHPPSQGSQSHGLTNSVALRVTDFSTSTNDITELTTGGKTAMEKRSSIYSPKTHKSTSFTKKEKKVSTGLLFPMTFTLLKKHRSAKKTF